MSIYIFFWDLYTFGFKIIKLKESFFIKLIKIMLYVHITLK